MAFLACSRISRLSSALAAEYLIGEQPRLAQLEMTSTNSFSLLLSSFWLCISAAGMVSGAPVDSGQAATSAGALEVSAGAEASVAAEASAVEDSVEGVRNSDGKRTDD